MVSRHRLFKNFHAVIGQSFRQTDRRLGVVCFVGIYLDKHLASNSLAHFRHAQQVEIDLAAHFEF
jgi:hypothetical protein